MQQMVSVGTPHFNGTRLGLAHSSRATKDQPLSFGSGHGGFGHPRQLILSEEHSKLRNSDEGLALLVQPGAMMPATYTPYHGHAYDGPTPATVLLSAGCGLNNDAAAGGSCRSTAVAAIATADTSAIAPPAIARATAPAAVICAASATADTPAHVDAFGATSEPTDTSLVFSVP